MSNPDPKQPVCPRCGGSRVTLCGESVEYGPEERPNQPLEERELHTLAYQCDCGMGFTTTMRGGSGTSDADRGA